MLIFSAFTIGMERSELFQKANIYMILFQWRASPVALVVKNLPVNARDLRDAGSIPGSIRFPGTRHSKLLQYFYLENPMDRGVHGVAKSRTPLKQLSTHACTSNRASYRFYQSLLYKEMLTNHIFNNS